MSKAKALLWAFIWTGIAFLFLYWQLSGCFFIFLLIGLSFAMIAALKYRRDGRLIAEAEQLQYLPPPAVLPPMSSPNSNRLFVPPPLDRRP